MDDSRFEVVDFLPPMYMYEYIFRSKNPDQIASYNTIVYPFDVYTWTFITISMMAQFFVLLVTQNMWAVLSGNTNPQDYIFEGGWFNVYINCMG